MFNFIFNLINLLFLLGNYLHLIGSGHLIEFLREHGSFFQYMCQAWEALNGELKRFFLNQTSHGSGNKHVAITLREIMTRRALHYLDDGLPHNYKLEDKKEIVMNRAPNTWLISLVKSVTDSKKRKHVEEAIEEELSDDDVDNDVNDDSILNNNILNDHIIDNSDFWNINSDSDV